jgi:hypothetical protein
MEKPIISRLALPFLILMPQACKNKLGKKSCHDNLHPIFLLGYCAYVMLSRNAPAGRSDGRTGPPRPACAVRHTPQPVLPTERPLPRVAPLAAAALYPASKMPAPDLYAAADLRATASPCPDSGLLPRLRSI